MPRTKKVEQPDFEQSLDELEKIVERMERAEQSLEQSLQDFERGMELSRICQKSLEQAEQRVEKLVQKHSGYVLEPLEEGKEE